MKLERQEESAACSGPSEEAEMEEIASEQSELRIQLEDDCQRFNQEIDPENALLEISLVGILGRRTVFIERGRHAILKKKPRHCGFQKQRNSNPHPWVSSTFGLTIGSGSNHICRFRLSTPRFFKLHTGAGCISIAKRIRYLRVL